MAGVYIHIPFCRWKCAYCDFYSEPFTKDEFSRFLQALNEEIKLQTRFFDETGQTVDTLFFGGGTPSLLSVNQLDNLLSRLSQVFMFSDNCEISLESNPGTLDEKYLSDLLAAGINRLSIGIQSLNNNELRLLERLHTAAEAETAVKRARDIGYNNLGIDLIFGLPGQKTIHWEQTLLRAVQLNPNHMSCYALTWSKKTPLGERIETKGLPRPSEDVVSEMFLLTSEILTASGYEHYEISNYARAGYRCRHNEGYWNSSPYLGLGPAAHSFKNNRRHWNIDDVHEYSTVLLQQQLPVKGDESLSSEQLKMERIALGLRTMEGIPLTEVAHAEIEIDGLCQAGLAVISNNHLSLTPSGFLIADEIALKLT